LSGLAIPLHTAAERVLDQLAPTKTPSSAGIKATVVAVRPAEKSATKK